MLFSGCCTASSLSGQRPRTAAEESGGCDGFKAGNGVVIPDAQVNNVLCSASEATEQYLVTFRLGPATDGFQATAYTSAGNRCGPGWVDIQLLVGGGGGGGGGDGHQLSDGRIGSPMRYPLAPKIDAGRSVLSELVMLVLKRGKMQPITALQLCHSSPGQLLLLYDFTVVDLTMKAAAAAAATDPNASKPAEAEAVLQRASLNCFITGQLTTVRVVERRRREEEEVENLNPKAVIPKLRRHNTASGAEAEENEHPFDWMSVELTTLDSAERLSFSLLALGAASLLVMAVMDGSQLSRFQAAASSSQHFLFFHLLNWLDLAESWPWLALFLLLSSVLGWLLLSLLQLLFTLAIKRRYVIERIGQLCSGQPETSVVFCGGSLFSLLRLAWLTLFIALGLAAFAYAACLSRKLDYALAGVWSAATMLMLVLTLGAWRLTGDGVFAWARAVRAQATYFSVLQADGRTYAAVRVDDRGRMAGCTSGGNLRSGSTIAALLLKEPKSGDSSRREHVRESIGPKLVNPRLRWRRLKLQQQEEEEKSLEKKKKRQKERKKKKQTTHVKQKAAGRSVVPMVTNGNKAKCSSTAAPATEAESKRRQKPPKASSVVPRKVLK